MIAKISSSLAIKYSFPSTFISFGPYLENKTFCPGLIDTGIICPCLFFAPDLRLSLFLAQDVLFGSRRQ